MTRAFMDRTFNLLSLGLIRAPWEEKRNTLVEVPTKATFDGVGLFRRCSQRKGEGMESSRTQKDALYR